MSVFDCRDYLALARDLNACDNCDPLYEARQRSSVSRAYYSAFLFARARRCRSNAKHWEVFEKYENSHDRTLISIGQRLRQLYADRCNADYWDQVPDSYLLAEDAIEEAEQLRKLIDTVPQTP
jgi:uncharacterized protein (UPF0332 family)